MFRAAFPLPHLYLLRRTKTAARKGAYERTIYYEIEKDYYNGFGCYYGSIGYEHFGICGKHSYAF